MNLVITLEAAGTYSSNDSLILKLGGRTSELWRMVCINTYGYNILERQNMQLHVATNIALVNDLTHSV